MNVIEKINNLETKVKSASAKQIIMWMVEALRNPVMEVDMSTFGTKVELSDRAICVGCAATNFICSVGEIDPNDYIVKSDWGIIGYEPIHELNDNEHLFTSDFEQAIDCLRLGDIKGYNAWADALGIARIDSNFDKLGAMPLIHTGNYTNPETLQYYVDLANAQE